MSPIFRPTHIHSISHIIPSKTCKHLINTHQNPVKSWSYIIISHNSIVFLRFIASIHVLMVNHPHGFWWVFDGFWCPIQMYPSGKITIKSLKIPFTHSWVCKWGYTPSHGFKKWGDMRFYSNRFGVSDKPKWRFLRQTQSYPLNKSPRNHPASRWVPGPTPSRTSRARSSRCARWRTWCLGKRWAFRTSRSLAQGWKIGI